MIIVEQNSALKISVQNFSSGVRKKEMLLYEEQLPAMKHYDP
jgi:hypothetical protein